MTRTEARELLMQLLFQMEVQDDYGSEMKDKYLEEHFQGSGQKEYASRLMGAVLGNLEEIDKKLSIYSKRKSIKRMAKVDLAIARLGAGEILYMEDIPGAVAINEAVDMAKKYSADESRKFINGLLGQIIKCEDE
ncbi:MAG: transcription antitermination factor NusB [Firmicutes bacterium]|nr:transcription antitermination factor NusB [Bacillota bacterium]